MENQIIYSFHLDKQESESLMSQIRKSSRYQIGTLNHLENLRRQIGTSSLGHGGRGYLPYVFTEQELGKKYFACVWVVAIWIVPLLLSR